MICYYIDRTNYNKGEQSLAELSIFCKYANFIDPKFGITLVTCHRIEYYLNCHSPNLFPDEIMKKFNIIFDSSSAYSRLFGIAVGLNSKILGENSIYKQVSRSINDYLYYNPNDRTLMNILIDARKIRDKFNYYAKNHGQLIYADIKNGKSKSILFFGAGLLTQTIISDMDCTADYKNIIIVTRNIRKANKHFRTLWLPYKIVEISKIDRSCLSDFFDVFIATDCMSHAYYNEVINICKMTKCCNVVDLCSVPLAELSGITANYFSLYSKNTEKLIEKSNVNIGLKHKTLTSYMNNNKLI